MESEECEAQRNYWYTNANVSNKTQSKLMPFLETKTNISVHFNDVIGMKEMPLIHKRDYNKWNRICHLKGMTLSNYK